MSYIQGQGGFCPERAPDCTSLCPEYPCQCYSTKSMHGPSHECTHHRWLKGEPPVDPQQQYYFEVALGDFLRTRMELARDNREDHIDIEDLNTDVLRDFFDAGWAAGEASILE